MKLRIHHTSKQNRQHPSKLLTTLALFAGLMLLAATSGWTQGSESFVNLDAPTSSYVDGSFAGNNEVEWSYNQVRKVTDATYYITDPSAGFRDTGTRFIQATIEGGIGSLEYKTRSYFTGGNETNRTIRVLVNGDEVDNYTLEAMGTVYTRTIENIDVAGTFTLRFEATGTRQIIIDDIEWTGFVPEGDVPPSLGPASISDIGAFAAQLNGEVTSDGGAAVTARGFVYAETSTNADPIIDGEGVTEAPSEDGTGSFSENISGLTQGTNYSVKAYATNAEGTSYSSVVSFNTLVTLGVGVYTEDFENFVSEETMPASWELDHDYNYGGVFGSGTAGGLRGDGVMGFQLTGSAPNNNVNATLTLQNNTGATITDLAIKYTGKVERVTQTGTPKWVVSVDGTDYPELEYGTADGVDKEVFDVVSGLSIEDEALFEINWFTTSTGTSGTRRQIGITDVEISVAVQYTDLSDPAAIPADATISVSGNVDLENSLQVKNVYIQEDNSLIITSNGTLAVTGSFNNEAGAGGLIIRSDETGTGSLIHNTPGVEATVQRYIPASASWAGKSGATHWHFLSSPVVEQSIEGIWTPSGGDGDYDFYAYDEANNRWLNQKEGANNINSFQVMRGYLAAYQQEATRVFEGALNVESYYYILSSSGDGDDQGWNLMGNPYSSAIDWNLAPRGLFASEYVYIYNPSRTVEGEPSPGYETIDGSEPGAIIPAHQAFFVKAPFDSGGEIFTFSNGFRVHGDPFIKKETTDDRLALMISNGDYADQTTIRIRSNSEYSLDRLDAVKLFSFHAAAPQLFSKTTDQKRVSVNSIPSVHEEVEIALGMRLPADGEYSLSLQEFGGSFEDVPLLLKDRKEGVVHDLKASPAYIFMDDGGDLTDRFALLFHRDVTGVEDRLGGSDDLTRIYVYGQTLYMEFASGDVGRLLEVFDTSGRLLMREDLDAGSRLSRALNLQPGVYVVRVSGPQGAETRRILLTSSVKMSQ